ncbi:Sec63-domain-containing protein [Pluteus cervinus]|uniref:Sec63-domain-containing protein n=1 Tax=Pluteus cervinus TaxID=181527 RepID=A0ACD3BCG5_9AGAR|nr:Sec63-domain-containing protein [Pluteus cervinus]
MSRAFKHLETLFGNESSSDGLRSIEDWEKVPQLESTEAFLDDHVDGFEDDLESVIIRYDGVGDAHPSESSGGYISRILNVGPLLEPLGSLLSSDRPEDAIHHEVVELLGLENIELAMEIIGNLPVVRAELRAYQARHNSTPAQGLGVPRYPEQDYDKGPRVLSPHEQRQRLEAQLQANASRPLFSGTAEAEAEVLPHVYTSSTQGTVLSAMGSKYMLPLGTERHNYEDFEEVIIPPAKPVPPRASERLVLVNQLDNLAKGCFPGYKSLNRIQSVLYPTAYQSNENLLVCAPTGAGKTDVAMLTILRVLRQYQRNKDPEFNFQVPSIEKDSFKIIYVAPMKALASEIVRKLGRRLKWLSISVRELTGDMQLTKQEIAETQIIVTTPEKWDVVTRKPTGEGELASLLKLLIIDEVHLLNEERGAVIETIVARTLRQVESTQSLIRIVGLSATLPNYVDVAAFLSASRYKGLFFFDSSFRPVPLEQHFLGIRGKPGSPQSKKNLDRVTFKKVSDLVAQGHQVMVFVHARRETVKSALALQEMAVAEGNIDDFSCQDLPQWSGFRREIGESRNKEMRQLFDAGFGIHHAGMLRSDRNMMEKMFEAKAIKVLCCTATLAWGVNLPAHAVIIKGTQVYDSAKGSFVDLSVLDVLQIFGRAGRPGLETSGEGYICTTEDKLAHYLDAVNSQHPIESQFQAGLVDALNAEISLGTVASVSDGIQWLSYTYLFVRMRKNPFVYGIGRDTLVDDPQLSSKRTELVHSAAHKLAEASMIIFDRQKGTFQTTSLGRIAAKYYIRHASVEIFNKKFQPRMSEADVLLVLCQSAEFKDIQFREQEVDELKGMMELIPCEVKGVDTSQDKVNILLQAYVSRVMIQDFALVSDTAFVAQNGGRILRALLEIAISKKWAGVSAVLMGLSKAVEKKMWPTEHPLSQFSLRADVLYGLQQWADEWSVSELAQQRAADLGTLVHLNEHHGQALLSAAKQFPSVRIHYLLRPLGHDVLRIDVKVERAFTWNARLHGNAEPFWVWVEDEEGLQIHQSAFLLLRQETTVINLEFVISIPDGIPPEAVLIRSISDRWLGAEDELIVPLDALVMPTKPDSHTIPLDLPFLSVTTFKQPVLERVYARYLTYLNNIQTQAFWPLMRTKAHSLLCAPTGCGKSFLGRVLAWLTAQRKAGSWVLIIAPRKSVVGETLSELRPLTQQSDVKLLHGASDWRPPKGKLIQVLTASQLMEAFIHDSSSKSFTDLDLVICENLEQLNSTYELALSLLRHATQASPVRFVGLSNSLLDATGLADWLNVEPFALNSFRPQDRDQSLTFSVQTFNIPQSASLFKAMIKPAHTAIHSASPGDTAIIFVPSRSHCWSIARDLIKQSTIETETNRGYLPNDFSDDLLEALGTRLQNQELLDLISRGIGFFHEGLHRSDWSIMLELFVEGVIRVLIVPRDSCWSLPIRAAVVVVMGTQYTTGSGPDRQLRDYELAELVRMQGRAIRHTSTGHFHLFCQAESKETFSRFLQNGLPLESTLLDTDDMTQFYLAKKREGHVLNRQDLVDILTFTYLARRTLSNPVYYGNESPSLREALSRVADRITDDAEHLDHAGGQET